MSIGFRVRAVYSEQSSMMNGVKHKKNSENSNPTDFFSLVDGLNPNDNNKDSEKPFTLDYLDKHNAFAGLSIDDIRTFREILSDGRVKGEELSKLSFNQLKRFDKAFAEHTSAKIDDDKQHIVVPSGVTFDNVASNMLDMLNFTENDKFNNSLVNTVKNMNAEQLEHISDFTSELRGNIVEMILGKKILPSFMGGGMLDASNFDKLKHLTKDIDYSQLLDVYLPQLVNMIEESYNKGVLKSNTYKEEKIYVDIYKNIRDNYHRLK